MRILTRMPTQKDAYWRDHPFATKTLLLLGKVAEHQHWWIMSPVLLETTFSEIGVSDKTVWCRQKSSLWQTTFCALSSCRASFARGFHSKKFCSGFSPNFAMHEMRWTIVSIRIACNSLYKAIFVFLILHKVYSVWLMNDSMQSPRKTWR